MAAFRLCYAQRGMGIKTGLKEVLAERGEVNENVAWGCNVAANQGRKILRACLIRQCLRRAVP